MNLFRANLVLAAAVAALAAPTVWVVLDEQELFKDVDQIPRLFDGFDASQVAALALGEPKPPAPTPPGTAPAEKPKVEHEQLTFVRDGDKGFVLQNAGDLTGAPVNAELLESQIWKHLAEIRADRETLVQADATDEQLAAHGLDEAHAFVVKAVNAQQQVLAHLLVGNDASGGKYGTEVVRGLFVRSADSRDIVLYEVPYWQRQIKADVWLDKTLLKAPADSVRRIALRNASTNGRTITFERPAGKTSWTCAEPPEGRAAVRQSEVEMLAQRFGWMVAQEFKMPLQRANLPGLGLESPQLEIAVTYLVGDAERTATFAVGNKVDDKPEHYLKTSLSPFLLTWPAHFVTPFERDVTELFDPAAPAPGDPAKEEPKKDEPGKDGQQPEDGQPKKDQPAENGGTPPPKKDPEKRQG